MLGSGRRALWTRGLGSSRQANHPLDPPVSASKRLPGASNEEYPSAIDEEIQSSSAAFVSNCLSVCFRGCFLLCRSVSAESPVGESSVRMSGRI